MRTVRDIPELKDFPFKGVYTLVVFLRRGATLRVRELGFFSFQKGYYAYTGSAVGDGAVSLRKRVARHLRREKTRHWHIDFFLENENARIVAVVAAETSINMECQVNDAIKNLPGAMIPVAGFGATDCKQNCGSHLVRFSSKRAADRIARAYAHLFENRKVHSINVGMK
jgi:Uri superfamily endonuclease